MRFPLLCLAAAAFIGQACAIIDPNLLGSHYQAYEALQRVSVQTGYRLAMYRLDHTAPFSVYESFLTPVQGIIKFGPCHLCAMNQFASLVTIISEQSPMSTPSDSFRLEELTLYVTPFGSGIMKGDDAEAVEAAIMRQVHAASQ